MPEEAVTTTRETQAAPSPGDVPASAASEPGSLNPGLVILFVVIVVLIAVQNRWLRRRAERETRSGDEAH
jgi:hypothetical protein